MNPKIESAGSSDSKAGKSLGFWKCERRDFSAALGRLPSARRLLQPNASASCSQSRTVTDRRNGDAESLPRATATLWGSPQPSQDLPLLVCARGCASVTLAVTPAGPARAEPGSLSSEMKWMPCPVLSSPTASAPALIVLTLTYAL